jgi:hypothetical protein
MYYLEYWHFIYNYLKTFVIFFLEIKTKLLTLFFESIRNKDAVSYNIIYIEVLRIPFFY